MGVSLFCIAAIVLLGLWIHRSKRPWHFPEGFYVHVLVINMYEEVPNSVLAKIIDQYKGKVRIQVSEKKVWADEKVYKEEFELGHQRFVEKMLKEKPQDITYETLCKGMQEHKSEMPNIVILCSDTAVFQTSEPFLLSSAELLHYRQKFSISVLNRSLEHYLACDIRNGK
ncbi:hypothetical protein NECID01_0541 [Nematocida sp. AWRm77]|nr:hypothetical protein NECID01_0541 [Nematocida sp. AWRm77]